MLALQLICHASCRDCCFLQGPWKGDSNIKIQPRRGLRWQLFGHMLTVQSCVLFLSFVSVQCQNYKRSAHRWKVKCCCFNPFPPRGSPLTSKIIWRQTVKSSGVRQSKIIKGTVLVGLGGGGLSFRMHTNKMLCLKKGLGNGHLSKWDTTLYSVCISYNQIISPAYIKCHITSLLSLPYLDLCCGISRISAQRQSQNNTLRHQAKDLEHGVDREERIKKELEVYTWKVFKHG